MNYATGTSYSGLTSEYGVDFVPPPAHRVDDARARVRAVRFWRQAAREFAAEEREGRTDYRVVLCLLLAEFLRRP